MMVTKAEPITPTISKHLIEVCRGALDGMILAPSVEIRDIDVEVLRSQHFDSETPASSYVVTVSTNDATMVRGTVEAYKGSYKERLEAVLDRIVKEFDPTARAYVNIAGPNTPTVDRLIPIGSFIQGKKLSAASPIVRTARQNDIHYIQIRGRHLIAPSPAIAEFLERYTIQHANEIRRVADLFAGTAIATKILLRTAQLEKVVLIDNDPAKIRKIREHISDRRVEIMEADALRFSFVDKYDLAVADPYYEDVQLFLSCQIENLRRNVRVLILVPGNIEDRVWNAGVQSTLESFDYSVAAHELYGQVILEARIRG